MITDYENPIKKLAEEFNTHNQVTFLIHETHKPPKTCDSSDIQQQTNVVLSFLIKFNSIFYKFFLFQQRVSEALQSLNPIYIRRNQTGAQVRH